MKQKMRTLTFLIATLWCLSVAAQPKIAIVKTGKDKIKIFNHSYQTYLLSIEGKEYTMQGRSELDYSMSLNASTVPNTVLTFKRSGLTYAADTTKSNINSKAFKAAVYSARDEIIHNIQSDVRGLDTWRILVESWCILESALGYSVSIKCELLNSIYIYDFLTGGRLTENSRNLLTLEIAAQAEEMIREEEAFKRAINGKSLAAAEIETYTYKLSDFISKEPVGTFSVGLTYPFNSRYTKHGKGVMGKGKNRYGILDGHVAFGADLQYAFTNPIWKNGGPVHVRLAYQRTQSVVPLMALDTTVAVYYDLLSVGLGTVFPLGDAAGIQVELGYYNGIAKGQLADSTNAMIGDSPMTISSWGTGRVYANIGLQLRLLPRLYAFGNLEGTIIEGSNTENASPSWGRAGIGIRYTLAQPKTWNYTRWRY